MIHHNTPSPCTLQALLSQAQVDSGSIAARVVALAGELSAEQAAGAALAAEIQRLQVWP
jgi:hypothetical protein